MMKKRKLFSLSLLILYLAAVLYCCFGRFSDLPEIGQDTFWGIPTDKIVHFLLFFPFPILCFLTFTGRTRKPAHTVLTVGCVFLTGCVIAAATEIGQSLTDYRSGDILDFAADVTALTISSVAVTIIDLHIIKKHNKQICSKDS